MKANIPIWLFNTFCIIAIIFLFVGIVGVGVLIADSLEPRDGLNDVLVSFDVGCIDESGKVLNADNKLYTEDLIECTMFRITRNFSVYSQYEVHFYDKNGNHLDDDTYLTDEAELLVPGDFAMPEGAVGIRLVIIPNETDVNLKSWGILNIDRAIYAGAVSVEASNAKVVDNTSSSGGAVELAA